MTMSTMQATTHVYAIVEKGVVTNVIVASAEFIAAVPGHVRIDTVTPRPGLGWTYANTRWTAPAPVVERLVPHFQVSLDGLLPPS